MINESTLSSVVKRATLGPHTLSPKDNFYDLNQNGTLQLGAAGILGGVTGYIAIVGLHQQELEAVLILTGLGAIRSATEAIGSFRLANMARRRPQRGIPSL